MTVYVAEINGRAIAAFNAENDIQAEGRASSKPFRGDLTVIENEGQPLWRRSALIPRTSAATERAIDCSKVLKCLVGTYYAPALMPILFR
jgi:hypothetical protein